MAGFFFLTKQRKACTKDGNETPREKDASKKIFVFFEHVSEIRSGYSTRENKNIQGPLRKLS